MRKRIVIILVLSLILSGCTLTSNDREKQNKSKSIPQQKVETQEKKLKPAEIIDLKNIKFQFKSLGRLASGKSFIDAFGMYEYVGEGENLSGICMLSCGPTGSYWFTHPTAENLGKECESRILLLPEYGIKLYSYTWAGEEPRREKIIQNNTVLFEEKYSFGKVGLNLYKLPKGQTFRETITATRPEIKDSEIREYKKREFPVGKNAIKKDGYWGFGKNINDLNPEDLEIYKSEDNIFLQLKSQPNIFFVFNNYEIYPDPICLQFLFDIISNNIP